MASSRTERFVFICDIKISTFRDTFDAPPMTDILNQIFNNFQQGKYVQEIDRGKKVLKLRDIKELENDTYCLLVSIADEDFPDNVNENIKTGELIQHERKDNEYPAYSAHILISASGDNSYLTIIENVKGLGITKIQRFLNSLLKGEFKEDRKEPLSGEAKVYYPMFEIVGHQSLTIANALNNGASLEGIILTDSSKKRSVFGDDSYDIIEKKGIELKISNMAGANAVQYLKDFFKSTSKHDESKVRIKYRRRIKLCNLDTSHDDITSNYFIYQEKLDKFDSLLPVCCATIRSDMIIKMQNLLNGFKYENH